MVSSRRVVQVALIGLLTFYSFGCQKARSVEAVAKVDNPKFLPAPIQVKEDREADDLSRFLAGMQGRPGSPYEALQQSDAWAQHVQETDQLWLLSQEERFTRMAKFQKNELSAAPFAGGTLFYPFGGPDAMTALTLFPEKRQYVLVGLEPPGTMPHLKQFQTEAVAKPLMRMRTTTFSLLKRSFFITAEMDRQLRGQVTDGVLPVILVQLVRSGHRIVGYKTVTIDPEGKIVDRDAELREKIMNRGVAIEFENDDDKRHQTLVYLSTNLASDRLSKNEPFLKYMANLRPETTFFKSTSYMPHNDGFSVIREEVLKNTSAVVQDDSGIPFRFFNQKPWQVQLYGDYDKPYGSFRYLQQMDLKSAFQRKETVKPLDFPIGYGYKRIPSNLLVARKAS